MKPPECQNSKILTPGVPAVDLCLSSVLSRNFHLAFLFGAGHQHGVPPLLGRSQVSVSYSKDRDTDLGPQTSQAFPCV